MKLTIIILILSILIVGSTAYVGIKFSDGVVTQDYYEKGLIYDKRKELIEDNGLELNIANIKRNNDSVKVSYKLLSNAPIQQKDISVSIVRPGTMHDSFPIELSRENDMIIISFTSEKRGHFMLRNDLNIGETLLNLEKNFYVN